MTMAERAVLVTGVNRGRKVGRTSSQLPYQSPWRHGGGLGQWCGQGARAPECSCSLKESPSSHKATDTDTAQRQRPLEVAGSKTRIDRCANARPGPVGIVSSAGVNTRKRNRIWWTFYTE
jgi:hypothetical protein